jgi:transcription antitermination factor NusG
MSADLQKKPERQFTVHQTVPNQMRRAIAEAKRAGVKPCVPKVRQAGRAVRILNGYMLLESHVPDATYIHRGIGTVNRSDVRALYDRARDQFGKVRRHKAMEGARLRVGENVEIVAGPFAGKDGTILSVMGEWALILCPHFPRIKVKQTQLQRRKKPPKAA